MLDSLHRVTRHGGLAALAAVGIGLVLLRSSDPFAWTLLVLASAVAMYRRALRDP